MSRLLRQSQIALSALVLAAGTAAAKDENAREERCQQHLTTAIEKVAKAIGAIGPSDDIGFRLVKGDASEVAERPMDPDLEVGVWHAGPLMIDEGYLSNSRVAAVVGYTETSCEILSLNISHGLRLPMVQPDPGDR